jgi:hypothetical protein
MPSVAAAVPEFPTALHDLTAAVRYPRRTFEYCRMAVEVVRRHFDPPAEKDWKTRWRKGDEAMCSALHLKRSSLHALEAVAARSRHGELVVSMTGRCANGHWSLHGNWWLGSEPISKAVQMINGNYSMSRSNVRQHCPASPYQAPQPD